MIYWFQTLSLKVRFLAVVLLLFPVLLFRWLMVDAPWALASLKALSRGVGLPDEQFWFAPGAYQGYFEAWGEAGRSLYLSVLAPTDVGFLLSYGLLFTAATLYWLKKANPSARWYLLALVPLGAAAADLLENLTNLAAAFFYPVRSDVLGAAAGAFTVTKWSLSAVTMVVLLVGTVTQLVAGAWSRLRSVWQRDE